MGMLLDILQLFIFSSIDIQIALIARLADPQDCVSCITPPFLCLLYI